MCQEKDRYTELAFNATVPGSILNELVNAGMTCPDIFWRDNAETVQKYENYNWLYTKVFTVEQLPSGRAILVFESQNTSCNDYLIVGCFVRARAKYKKKRLLLGERKPFGGNFFAKRAGFTDGKKDFG